MSRSADADTARFTGLLLSCARDFPPVAVQITKEKGSFFGFNDPLERREPPLLTIGFQPTISLVNGAGRSQPKGPRAG